jgi:hypothetical protein
MVKYHVHQTLIINYLGGILAPSSHCSILLRPSMAGKASQEIDLSIAPMGAINSKFDELRIYRTGHKRSNIKFVKDI